MKHQYRHKPSCLLGIIRKLGSKNRVHRSINKTEKVMEERLQEINALNEQPSFVGNNISQSTYAKEISVILKVGALILKEAQAKQPKEALEHNIPPNPENKRLINSLVEDKNIFNEDTWWSTFEIKNPGVKDENFANIHEENIMKQAIVEELLSLMISQSPQYATEPTPLEQMRKERQNEAKQEEDRTNAETALRCAKSKPTKRSIVDADKETTDRTQAKIRRASHEQPQFELPMEKASASLMSVIAKEKSDRLETEQLGRMEDQMWQILTNESYSTSPQELAKTLDDLGCVLQTDLRELDEVNVNSLCNYLKPLPAKKIKNLHKKLQELFASHKEEEKEEEEEHETYVA